MLARCIAATCAVALAAILTPGSMAASTVGPGCYVFADAEAQVARLTNATRARHGLGGLRVDPELSRVAHLHSYWMARLGRLYHSRRLGWKVTNWTTLGENVGVGRSLESLHREFMGSAGHRANILRADYVNVGAAVERGHGRYWVTVIFESVQDPGTRLSIPSC